MKNIDLVLLDEGLMPVEIVQKFTSLIWQQSYYNIGTFELYVPYQTSIFKASLAARFVLRTDKKQVGYIETIKEASQNGKQMLIISGYLIEGVMQKRIFHPASFGGFMVSGGYLISILSDVLPKILNKATVSVRELSSSKPYCWLFAQEQSIEYLSTIVYSSLESYKCSLSHRLNDYGNIEFSIYEGLDRTISQNINAPKLYSENMGNVSNIIYQKSEAGCRDVVIVIGIMPQNVQNQTQGTIVSFTYNPNNINLSEDLTANHVGIIRDVKLDETVDSSGNKSYIYNSDATMKYFEQEAKAEFIPISENFSAEVLDFEGVSLGDIVSVRDDERGMTYSRRIESLTESYNPNKDTISVNFGKVINTSTDILKRTIGLR